MTNRGSAKLCDAEESAVISKRANCQNSHRSGLEYCPNPNDCSHATVRNTVVSYSSGSMHFDLLIPTVVFVCLLPRSISYSS